MSVMHAASQRAMGATRLSAEPCKTAKTSTSVSALWRVEASAGSGLDHGLARTGPAPGLQLRHTMTMTMIYLPYLQLVKSCTYGTFVWF